MATSNWTAPDWRQTVFEWIGTQFDRLGYSRPTSVEQVTVSPTSCVLRAHTDKQIAYFKASAPPFMFEPQLTQTLAEKLPTAVPPVLAIDNQRAWMLMADGGNTLRRLTLAEDDQIIEGSLAHWRAMLTSYAALQQATLLFLDELQASGCPSRRLDELPGLYKALIADMPALTAGDGDALNQAQIDQLPAFASEVERMCAELAAYGIPETLHHDDLGANNVLFDGQTHRFFDWAESCITHPFCSLTIVLRYARYVVKWDEATLNELRDTYLSAWLAYAPMDKLLETWMLAHRLGKLCRALTWHTVISQLGDADKQQFAGSTPYWLRLFVDDVED